MCSGNSCKQREELGLRSDTYSLWGYLAVSVSQDDQFVNPLYDRSRTGAGGSGGSVLPFQSGIVVPQNVAFWTGLYCQFETGAHPREAVLDLLSITQNHTTSLEDHGRQLTKTIGRLPTTYVFICSFFMPSFFDSPIDIKITPSI